MSFSLYPLFQKKKSACIVISFILFIHLFTYSQTIILHLGRALSYLHNLRICHRDIKPQNLLFDKERQILKLCDFGSAKVLDEKTKSITYICSRYYRAPELLMGYEAYGSYFILSYLGFVVFLYYHIELCFSMASVRIFSVFVTVTILIVNYILLHIIAVHLYCIHQ